MDDAECHLLHPVAGGICKYSMEDGKRAPEAAEVMKLTARDLKRAWNRRRDCGGTGRVYGGDITCGLWRSEKEDSEIYGEICGAGCGRAGRGEVSEIPGNLKKENSYRSILYKM